MPNSSIKEINNYDGAKPEPPYETELQETIDDLRDTVMDLEEKIEILSCTHPLFYVYRYGKAWRAEYRGKGGRLRQEGCQTAQEALSWVEWMKERVKE